MRRKRMPGGKRYTEEEEGKDVTPTRRFKNTLADGTTSPFLKERLFGLSNPQGNHGEGVREAHFHVDNTPVRCLFALLAPDSDSDG
jgi:hypothetical protein